MTAARAPKQLLARTRAALRPIVITTAVAGTLAFTLHLLFSALCAFSWQNFLMSDYGVYTNTIWNLAHGNGFKFLVTHNYLKTHLSFSLAVLTPLFYLWDNPLLLIVVQWSFLVSGMAVLFMTMCRAEVPSPARWVILLLYAASPFTQGVMLSEFHGVSAYLLLVPVLYYCTCFRKAWTAVPLLLILGLREDAGFLLPAFFAYRAWRDNWKAGYVYAALSAAYALAATLWLYPLVNGISLFEVRKSEAGLTSIAGTLGAEALFVRARATLWFLAAYLPFLTLRRLRAWPPLLVFPALPYIIAMASGFARQHTLSFHYPAALMAFAAVGMIQAWRNIGREARGGGTAPPGTALWFALAMVAVVSVSHRERGYFLGGANTNRVYTGLQPGGRALYRASRGIPREGTLLCTQWQAVFCANRENITTWTHKGGERPDAVDLVFCDCGELLKEDKLWISKALRNGTFGVWSEYFPYIVLKRGHDTNRNAALLEGVDSGMRPFATMPFRRGLALEETGLVTYWNGDGNKAPCWVAHGHKAPLETGRYLAHFTLKAATPRRGVRGNWGYLSLYVPGNASPIAEQEIAHLAHTNGEFRVQSLPVELQAPTTVDPRVTGGDAELWLKSVSFTAIADQ